jgi:hypothetical protein
VIGIQGRHTVGAPAVLIVVSKGHRVPCPSGAEREVSRPMVAALLGSLGTARALGSICYSGIAKCTTASDLDATL